MTSQSGGGGLQPTQTVGGVLTGLLTAPSFATNGTTPILGVLSAVLGANVTMTNANQFYDGPSVALTPGSWIIGSGLSIGGGPGAGHVTGKLWDGTTVLVSQGIYVPGSGQYLPLVLAYPVAITVPATYRVSVAGNNAANVISAAAATNPAGNTASWILAVRVA